MPISDTCIDTLMLIRRQRAQVREAGRINRAAQVLNVAQQFVMMMQSRCLFDADGWTLRATPQEQAAYDAALAHLTVTFALTEPGSR